MSFVFIFVLIAVLVYSPAITYSVPNRSNSSSADCKSTGKQSQNGLALVKCCWKTTEGYPGLRKDVTYCSTCEDGGTRGKINCTDPVKQFTGRIPDEIVAPQDGVLEQPPTFAPGTSPGVLEQLQQNEGVPPELGFLERQQQPPTDQEAATPQFTEPVCPQDQVFDEETGLCVLEEPDAQEQAEPEDQSSDGEEQQSAEEDDGSDGSDENTN